MSGAIKKIFDSAMSDVAIDNRLFKQIDRFAQQFIYKNDDHVNFFGSNLTGVYPVRFTTQEKNDWNIDLLDLDESEIRREILRLPYIKDTWVRGTDVMNLSCLYLVHRIQSDANMNPKIKHRASMDVLLALHFKLISSLMAWFFKYPVDPRIAEMTYANLSKKFAIKRFGSWYKVLENRCADIISAQSTWKTTIERFNDDMAIQNMINDIQGRLRAMIKKIWAVMAQVREDDAKMLIVSAKVDLGDKVVVRDLIRDEQRYRRYLKDISIDRRRFVKDELINIIGNVMTTMPEAQLEAVLIKYSELCTQGDADTLKLGDEILLHAFENMGKDRSTGSSAFNIGATLQRFRRLYIASRNKEVKMMFIKEQSELIAAAAAKTKSSTMVSSLRTGLLLYILLRTLSYEHYK